MKKQSQRFHLLDGLRGLAAILVVVHHSPSFLFWGWRPTLAASVVDFFFVLSGFVLSSAYGERVASRGQFFQLAILRISRLYPLYILGTAIAVLVLLGSLMVRGDITDFHKALWLAIPFAILMLPAPGFGVTGNIFPLNLPAWSLFDEILANFTWFMFGPSLTVRKIFLIVIVGFAGLIYYQDDLNGGWSRQNYQIGFFRVAYSFFLGVLLFKISSKLPPGCHLHTLFIVTIFILTSCFIPESFQIIAITLIYPIIVLLGSQAAVGGVGKIFCDHIGRLSYPIYAIHVPLGSLLFVTLKKLGVTDATLTTIMYSVIVVVLAQIAASVYDQPMQSALLRVLGSKKKRMKTD